MMVRIALSQKELVLKHVPTCALCQHHKSPGPLANLTDPFTNLELQNPSHDVPELHKICQSPDLKALNCEKAGRE